MNLGRAKTVLVFAFLGLNLFLAYCLFWPELSCLRALIVYREEMRQVEAELNRNNLILEAPLTRSVQKSAFAAVSPSVSELNRLRLLFSVTAYADAPNEEGVQVFHCFGKTARVYPGGLVQVAYSVALPLDGAGDGVSDTMVAAAVEQTLKKEKLWPPGAEFDYLERESRDGLVIRFYRNDDGQHLFSSYLTVALRKERIETVDIFWLDLVEWSQERSVEVISAAEALCRVIREIGPGQQPRRIVQVDLGFYSQEYNAERWEVPPVWRIRLDNGETYYINAFTGNQETGSDRGNGPVVSNNAPFRGGETWRS